MKTKKVTLNVNMRVKTHSECQEREADSFASRAHSWQHRRRIRDEHVEPFAGQANGWRRSRVHPTGRVERKKS